MHLRADLEERFRVELTEFEEQRQMPYLTSIERLAEARGEARGKAELVLALLAKICNGVPEEHQEFVRELPSERLEQLAVDLLHFQSLEDLQDWLDHHVAEDG